MNLQYISDSKGETTGVFIPINDWEYLKRKYKVIEREEKDTVEIPEWHKEIVLQRLKEYHSNPQNVLDWEEVQKEIEVKYGF
ncbi:MAG: addiction module protein [Mariniphaga sp.]